MKQPDNLQELISTSFDPPEGPVKSYTQLLAEGVPHKGGLRMLAHAEQMDDPPPAIASLFDPSVLKTLRNWREVNKPREDQ